MGKMEGGGGGSAGVGDCWVTPVSRPSAGLQQAGLVMDDVQPAGHAFRLYLSCFAAGAGRAEQRLLLAIRNAAPRRGTVCLLLPPQPHAGCR